MNSPYWTPAAQRVDRFSRIDALVNNTASFYAGYFEELTPEQFDRQLAASLIVRGARLSPEHMAFIDVDR